MKKIKGFTLIELIIVIAILGVLASIMVPMASNLISNSQEAVCKNNRASIAKLYQYYLQNGGTYNPDGTTGIQFLVDANLIHEPYRICPTNGDIFWEKNEDGSMGIYCTVHSSDNSNLLFVSNFNNMNKIKSLLGNWSVSNGKLVAPASGENRAIFEGTNGTDYNVKMNAVYFPRDNVRSGYGIYYRATDKANISGYSFQYDPGLGNSFVVRKVTDGREGEPFQRVNMTPIMGNTFNINDPHDIEIEVVGDKHIIKVDGIQVLNFNDNTFTEGNVGVRTWSNSNTTINSVTVEKK